MSEDKKFEIDPNMLKNLGIPEEFIDKILEANIPSVNTHAEGGNGGSAVSLTYVDNYSSLMLVYTFLQYTINASDKQDKETRLLNRSLLTALETAMREQKEYRRAFLDAVQLLNQQAEQNKRK